MRWEHKIALGGKIFVKTELKKKNSKTARLIQKVRPRPIKKTKASINKKYFFHYSQTFTGYFSI